MSAPKKPTWLSAAWLAAIIPTVLAGCTLGGSNNAANRPSPTASSPAATSPPSAAPSSSQPPPPVTGAYGVLYSSQAATTYTVSIVGVDGKVVASAETSTPPSPSCGSAAGAPVSPPVSMSNSAVYFMDKQGSVHWLRPTGEKDQAPIVTLPAPTASRRAMFAVSPDDAQMAVVVDDYTSSGASTQLLMYDLGAGGTQKQIFSESGSRTLWPIGWHGTNNLVLGVVTSCTQGGGPFCCGVLELHVVDPATATRRFTLGSISTSCFIVGAASSAGAICWDGTNSRVLSWTAATIRTYPVQGPELQLLSPSGAHIALIDNTATTVQGTNVSVSGMFACTWIDDGTLLSGGDPQHQPRVADVSSGTIIPVPSQGDCAGRLPGSL